MVLKQVTACSGDAEPSRVVGEEQAAKGEVAVVGAGKSRSAETGRLHTKYGANGTVTSSASKIRALERLQRHRVESDESCC